MALADRVHIARRFQRAIRIDTDPPTSSLEGSSAPNPPRILKTMTGHIAESGQGAFT